MPDDPIEFTIHVDPVNINIDGTAAIGNPGPPGEDGTDGEPGAPGSPGEDGLPGVPGTPGVDGVDGEPGADGREIEVATSATHIRWRYLGDVAWTDLIPLLTLTGPPGAPGVDGVDGTDGAPGTPGADGAPGQPGIDGDDGPPIEVQTSVTHIQWRVAGSGDPWADLIALSTLTGPPGAPGVDGVDGQDGLDGAPGVDGAPGAPGADADLTFDSSPTYITWPTFSGQTALIMKDAAGTVWNSFGEAAGTWSGSGPFTLKGNSVGGTPGGTVMNIGAGSLATPAVLNLNAPSTHANQIQFKRSSVNSWLLYDAGSASIHLRDSVNSVMALTFTPGATTTGLATFGGTVRVAGAKIEMASGGPQWITGTGTPEGVKTAPVGSLYTRSDGAVGTTLYVKETGTGNTGWVPVAAGGGGGGVTPDIQTFTTPGNNTWTKPTGAYTVVDVTVIGPGGGGGSGRRGATDTARSGGGGGAGGGWSFRKFLFSDFDATEIAWVGSGGTGGAAQTVDSTNGITGTHGTTSISSFAGVITAARGGPGGGGATTTGAAGAVAVNNSLFIGGPGGGGRDVGPVSTSGGAGAGGGGGASGITTANGVTSGKSGGATLSVDMNGGLQGNGPGESGQTGPTPVASYTTPATGGGGGASLVAGPGGNGGSGGYPGGGGGGGAASLNGYPSGAGGDGGNGVVVVICL